MPVKKFKLKAAALTAGFSFKPFTKKFPFFIYASETEKEPLLFIRLEKNNGFALGKNDSC